MAVEFAKKDGKQRRISAAWGFVDYGAIPAVGVARGVPVHPTSGRVSTRKVEGDMPDLASRGIARSPDDERASRAPVPTRGVLVVGMGDADRGDDGIGVHLTGCLAAMGWPDSVEFCTAGADVPKRAEKFARVLLIEAIDGPELPGSLYQADPQELMDAAVGGNEGGLGLLSMLSGPVRRRLSVFGIQPRRRDYGSDISDELILAMPVLVSYLRARILQAAAEAELAN